MFSVERTISGQNPIGRYFCHLGFSCLVWFNSQSSFFKSFIIMIITIITIITVKIQKSGLLSRLSLFYL